MADGGASSSPWSSGDPAADPASSGNHDNIHHFLMNCHRIVTNATFVYHSLPNADVDAVEGSISRLCAIGAIISSLDHPSLHNVRIERTWRDVRKDALETFRQIFMYLESCGLLDMENDIHRVCLYLVFRKRIQDALDRARDAWNHHQLRTEGNRSPIAIYELSREEAIRRGYWTGDADIFGDDPAIARDPAYGVDGETSQPFVDTSATEPLQRMEQPQGIDAERAAGIVINDDDEMSFAQQLLEGKGFDWDREDDNWGIYVYCEAVQLMASQFM
ncbi:hypothetical protein BD626DRAFT_412406 [Schizophyllum amplum]|uniref:Integrase core domain-containing protein n=1 Tax=Schizophyllum amplum TaxID=97359 RepID=A0A550BXF9_9AGAR|nr:hypothetical protein BD626DRAFT_412406 [Auriculariopsis ampla]